MIPQTKHKVVQHLVRRCDTVTSDKYGATPLSRKRCGKTRKIPGFPANLYFITTLSGKLPTMDKSTLLMLIRVPAILIALTVHELSHGYVAKLLGDNTAERNGRLTLNPLAHLDLFGALMLLFGPFGWAKPVPVNPLNFRRPVEGMAIVAGAGPLSNIVLAACAGLMLRFGIADVSSMAAVFLYILFMINIGIAVFNLLPVYPLDGSRIFMAFIKGEQRIRYIRIMNVVPKIFLGMILVEWVLNIPLLSYILNPIFNPAFRLAKAVFIGG